MNSTGTTDSTNTDDVAARLEREAAFHDHTAEDDTRLPAVKFYAASKASEDLYASLILQNINGKRILEYGCGTGGHTAELAQRGALLTGIDISPGAIAVAQKTVDEAGVADRVDLHVMNAEAMDFEDNTFDTVFGNSILHHLDLDACYKEINRVLKPGGLAVFNEPLAYNPLINWYRNRTPHMRTVDEHPMLIEDIERAGEVFSSVDMHFFHLTSLATVPFRNTALFKPLYAAAEGFDRVLMKVIPPLRKWAWRVVIVLRK